MIRSFFERFRRSEIAHGFVAIALVICGPVIASTDQPGEQPFPLPGNAVIQLEPGVYPQGVTSGVLAFGKSKLDQVAGELKLQTARKVFPWRFDHDDVSEIERQLRLNRIYYHHS